ncbi:MAG: methyltransferase domain-containing protein [Proteobacteria bacterium]|nr:methyltransferase domain-containing protein [Pseudomonadota bacterium]
MNINKITLTLLLIFLSYWPHSHAQELIANIAKYHQNSTWQKSTAIDLFVNFAEKANLKGNERLLDVCAGDGKITATMGQLLPNGHIVGIDISPNMVAFAKQHYGEKQPNITFEQKEATKLNYPQQFDVITSFTCMHLIANQKEVLKGIHASLKSNGKLLMIFPVTHGFGHALEKVTSSPKWQSYFKDFKPNWYFYNVKTYEQYLQETGFKSALVKITTQDETYANRAVFQDAISHWLAHLKVVPPNLREMFLDDLVTTYLQEFPVDKNGQIHFYVDNLIVQASAI